MNAPTTGLPLFSILIPSWNNLEILKITLGSIRKNSVYPHQVIVHVNEGTDGTLEWVRANNILHTHSEGNVGVCYGFNLPSSLATCDHLVLSDDDNYFCPGWDKYLYEEVQKQKGIKWCVSGTLIEREVTKNTCVIAPYNFGSDQANFDEEGLLREFDKISFADWQGSNWYPMVLPRQLWCAVGGLSVEFSPGMYSDPDFMMKLWHYGVRTFKGVSKARAYHFMSKTTSRVKRNNGAVTFLFKWGMSNSTFMKYTLNMGGNGMDNNVPFLKRAKDYFKRVWLALKGARS
ncbi:MAG: glycosyltransferase family 2 protein [Chitinophagaceae bacterium]|nr:glycosyltransferase family 2 protein [Chitinophagaceae bacterium]